MKQLKNYLTESAESVMAHFMLEYAPENGEGIEDYFKRNKKLDGDKIRLRRKPERYITLDEIKSVYEYAEEHQMPCPVIVDYKNKPGHFVFRRWVAQLSELFRNINILEDEGAPYMGLHNTNIKEDGKWFPSAEDYESVIAFAYNKKNYSDELSTDPENVKYVTGRIATPNSKAEQLMYFYANNQKSIDGIIDSLPDDLGKMQKLPTKESCTKTWIDLGGYETTTPNKTPKTDILSGKYRISVKKAGGSQLMSGLYHEARATFMAAAMKLNGEKQAEFINYIEQIFADPWPSRIDSRTEMDKRLDASQRNKDLTVLVQKVCEDKEFKRLVMREAMTGEVKFGENSPNTADRILVWDDITPENSRLYTIDDYLNKIFDKSKIYVAFKTSGKTSSSLRIDLK